MARYTLKCIFIKRNRWCSIKDIGGPIYYGIRVKTFIIFYYGQSIL